MCVCVCIDEPNGKPHQKIRTQTEPNYCRTELDPEPCDIA